MLFAAFAADIGLWYLAQWLYHFVQADVWARFTAILAVLLPQFALNLFEAIVPPESGKSTLPRVAGLLAVPMLVFVFTPLHDHGLVRGAVFLYVFGLLAAGLTAMAVRGQRSRSRAIQRRVRFLVLTGALAATFSLADFLWFVGAPLPPVGAVLAIVFLFLLAESMTRERLIDLYEMLGQLVVSTALAFSLAGIFYLFVVLIGGFNTMYLNAVLAAIVILVLFEPLRQKVEQYFLGVFFRERVDLEKAVTEARRSLAHVLQLDEMVQIVMTAIESSRRATGAALYLREPLRSDFKLGASFGPNSPQRLDGATCRPLLERLEAGASVALEEVAQRVAGQRRSGHTIEVAADEQLLAAVELLGPFHRGVCVGIRGEDRDLLGILVVVDDRVTDAFSADEIALLESLAVQIAVVTENSREYLRLQERDRLTTLGQMAAGLAHEVKNPLGAIKGAAQLLSEPAPDKKSDDEFLQIILEEVDRLDRVVGSVLNYARPSKGNPGLINIDRVVTRTLQVLAASIDDRKVILRAEVPDDLPLVRADDEQLRQVLMNLVHNAIQAGARNVTLSASSRRPRSSPWAASAAVAEQWVELHVEDDGSGIAPDVLKNLFVPFFTTKDKGTGLGLSISQRIAQGLGGRIEVSSQEGRGSTFTVVLPATSEAVATPRPASVVRRGSEEGAAEVASTARPEAKPA